MEITDLQGKKIEVTDLNGSIAMVSEFMEYAHVDATPSIQRFDKQRQSYWKDIYDKLIALKEQMEKGNNNNESITDI